MAEKICKRGREARGAVESDGPKTEGGGREARTQGNVVPFPRDWLGPREELVPFGKHAYPESEQRPEDPEVGEQSLDPPPADAFWGEGSAEIHAAMPAPETTKRPRRRLPRRRLPRRRLPRRRPTRRRAAYRAMARNFTDTAPASTRVVRPDGWLRSRAIRLAAGLLVAAICAAVALAQLGPSPAGPPNRAGATGAGGPAAGVIASGPATGAIVLALLRSNAQHKVAPAKRRGGGASRRRPHAVARGRVHTPKPVAHPTAVPVDTAPASTAPSATTAPDATSKPVTPTASSTGSSSPPVAESPSTTSTATHTSSTTRSGSHHPASITRPAFGALGTVAPGSSPDG